MNPEIYPHGRSRVVDWVTVSSDQGKPDKDAVLVTRAIHGMNVAQFVSFNPIGTEHDVLTSRFFAIAGNISSSSIEPREAIQQVLDNSGDGTVNIRSFTNKQHQGNPFIVGLKDVDDVVARVEDLARKGYTTIVHETIDVNDGGLNCVYAHGHVECLTGATPRGVENCEENVAVFGYSDFIAFVHTVYGPSYLPERIAAFLGAVDKRVEFSIHPKRRGVRHSHLIIWEESDEPTDAAKEILLRNRTHRWPNSASQLVGDKVFGLLETEAALRGCAAFSKVAENFTLRIGVPKTTVFPAHPNMPFFQFGMPAGSNVIWTRTCPKVQLPGKHPTFSFWADPMALLNQDHASNKELASCMVQEGVNAKISGAAMVLKTGELKIEGVAGFGKRFMEGKQNPSFEYLLGTPNDYKDPSKVGRIFGSEVMEKKILHDLCAAWGIFRTYFNNDSGQTGIRFEWAHDGHCLWILQLHVEQPQSLANVIFEGEPKNGWLIFEAGQTLDELRKLVSTAKKEERGICIKAKIGITSHIADVCRKAKIPTILE